MWTWKKYWDDCFAFAKTLVHLKVGAYKVINIIGFNSVSEPQPNLLLETDSDSHIHHITSARSPSG